jgi:hypothetical protein
MAHAVKQKLERSRKNFRRKEKFARRPPGQRSGRILSSGADTRSRWSREDIRLTDLR